MNYITHSLLSSFQYWKESEKPLEEFMLTLKKVRTTPTPAMQRGIDFEDDVRALCDNVLMVSEEQNPSYTDLLKTIGNVVKGGLWQQEVKRTIEVDGKTFLLFGYADVIKRNKIIDVKTTSSYEVGKYNKSTQHLIYMYCTDIPNFDYLIAQGGVTLENFYKESYAMQDDCESKIKERISEFLNFLENCPEAKEAYYTNWIGRS